jgi:hypothetical protein
MRCSSPVLATSDIRSNIRKETASKKPSRHVLDVEMPRKRNGESHQYPSFLERISEVASTLALLQHNRVCCLFCSPMLN